MIDFTDLDSDFGEKSRYAIERTNDDGTKTILGQAASKKATEAKLAIYRA